MREANIQRSVQEYKLKGRTRFYFLIQLIFVGLSWKCQPKISTNVQTAGPDNGCKTMKYEEEAKQFEKSLVLDQEIR